MTDSSTSHLQPPDQCASVVISVQITNIEAKMMQTNDCFIQEFGSSSAAPSRFIPIIQICGSGFLRGQVPVSTCMYVHGVFPYMYFRPADMKETVFSTEDSLIPFLDTIKKRLEDEMQLLFEQEEIEKPSSGAFASHKKQRTRKETIHKLEIVRKKSIYGFHPEAVLFVKVYCLNLNDIAKISRLLTDRCIFGPMQCYESHISPVLQFLQDSHLQGMNYAHFSKVKLRSCDTSHFTEYSSIPIEWFWDVNKLVNEEGPHSIMQRALASQQAHILDGVTSKDIAFSQPTENYIQKGLIGNLGGPRRLSVCAIECDVCIEDIVYLSDELTSSSSQPFCGSITYMPSLKMLWKEEQLRRLRADQEQDIFSTPPFSDTCHHETFLGDQQFQRRFDRLFDKGKELFEVVNNSKLSLDDEVYTCNGGFNHKIISQWATQKNSQQIGSNLSQIISSYAAPKVNDIESYDFDDNESIFSTDLDQYEDEKGSYFETAMLGSCNSIISKRRIQDSIHTQREIDDILSTSQGEGEDANYFVSKNLDCDIINDVRYTEYEEPVLEKSRRAITTAFLCNNIGSSPAKVKSSRRWSHNQILCPTTVDEVLLQDLNSKQNSFLSSIFSQSPSSNIKESYTCLCETIDSDVSNRLSFPPEAKISGIILRPSFSPPTTVSTIKWLSSNEDWSNIASVKKTIHLNFKTERFLIPTFSPPLSSSLCRFDRKFLPTQSSQLLSPTQTNSTCSSGQHNMKNNDTINIAVSDPIKSKTTTLFIEICRYSHSNKCPDPQKDIICAILWILESNTSSSEYEQIENRSGVICLSLEDVLTNTANLIAFTSANLPSNTSFKTVDSELELLEEFINVVFLNDPDFLIGYETQNSSIDYIIARGYCNRLNMVQLLSRFPLDSPSPRNEYDQYEKDHGSGLWLYGRTVLNLWRILTSEMKLSCYTIQHVVEELLNCQIPSFTYGQLSRWFQSSAKRSRVFRYMYQLCSACTQIMDKLDIIRRTSEYARLYGIDLFSVLSRGSQYRVEAVYIRIAHSLGFLAAAGSKSQVSSQAAMEVIPLVMEPCSGFYEDPVIVLDFQSLYPSMMIAYNLCFSTCLGKLKQGFTSDFGSDTTERLGFINYPEEATANSIFYECSHGSRPYLSPNGSIFCSKETHEGILPLMLQEILATRQMIKRSMKFWEKIRSSNGELKKSVLSRVLDARQLALKLLANVTYGYTSAGYSGRMPMAELADAIVQCGRSTLEWAIQFVEKDPSWNAQIVYGDTDSLFVHLKGRTKEEAFKIGRQIADRITELSPASVVLKLEKVYVGLFLVSKKRYVGFSYENADQDIPHFDDKGIETRRRDSCAVVQKMQEKALRIFLTTKNLSFVRQYLSDQWMKIHTGIGLKLPLTDFIFRKEVKLGSYSSESSMPPGAVVATKHMVDGKHPKPPHGWRVPYIVVWGSPRAPLRDLVVAPEDFLSRGSDLRVNHIYYIIKCINPSLDRLFRLCRVDINSWYSETRRPTPRTRRFPYHVPVVDGILRPPRRHFQMSITSFAQSNACEICGAASVGYLCHHCKLNPSVAIISVTEDLNRATKTERYLGSICKACCKFPQPATIGRDGKDLMIGSETCSNIDCAVFFERCRLIYKIEDLGEAARLLIYQTD